MNACGSSSLSPADQVQLTDEQAAELDRRIAMADGDSSAGIP
jgi:putative addiction module component (TIGR02574 family)